MHKFPGARVFGAIVAKAMHFAPILLAIAFLNSGALFAQAPSAAPAPTPAPAPAPKHTISVTFDYDFTSAHACSPAVKTKCVARFNVYDVSGVKAYPLFSIPVPAGANGAVKGITGASQPLLFESGKHRFAVTAQMDSGRESNVYACTVWAEIP